MKHVWILVKYYAFNTICNLIEDSNNFKIRMSRGDISTRIFVGGLDHSVNEADLEKAFKIFGGITNVVVLRDKETGRSRGFAFVSFKDSHSSEDAISRMHGVEIRGRCVSVRHAEKEKTFDDRPRRGGMRGSGRGGYTDTRERSDAYGGGGSSFGGNGFSGGSYRGGGSTYRDSDYNRGYGDRDSGNRGTASSSDGYAQRSRSPIANTLPYRTDSPPRRRIPNQGYSPPPSRRDDYSPRQAVRGGSDYFLSDDRESRRGDYYGGVRELSPPAIGDTRVMRGRSPVREEFHRHGTTLSPARERNAYINSRTREYSPVHRSDYKANPEPQSVRRRSVSPRDSEIYRNHPARRESKHYMDSTRDQYRNSSSLDESRGRPYDGKREGAERGRIHEGRKEGNEARSQTFDRRREDMEAHGRGSEGRRRGTEPHSGEYEDRRGNAGARELQTRRDTETRRGYEGRRDGSGHIPSSRYGATDGRYGAAASRADSRDASPPKRSSGIGGRVPSRSARDRSPAGRGVPSRRY